MPSDIPANPIGQIRRFVAANQYRVRLHAVRHMIEEGFDEDQLVEAAWTYPRPGGVPR
jgi:hypothetical protein